jgi:hypothetical protein
VEDEAHPPPLFTAIIDITRASTQAVPTVAVANVTVTGRIFLFFRFFSSSDFLGLSFQTTGLSLFMPNL